MGNASLNSGIGGGLSNDENELIGEHALKKQNNKNAANTTEEVENAVKENEVTKAQENWNQFTPIKKIPRVSGVEEYNAIEDIRQQCILYLWTIFFGRSRANLNEQLQPMPAKMMSITAERETVFMESESTSFSTTGCVKTADGREINFDLDVSMSRNFVQYTKETVENVASFIDPLVINLNGNVAEVSDQKFYFDLDADGEEDLISKLCEDSGYLALDKNEDGTINDGSELFGTQSGNGFADLSSYDEDANGWIDENDEIWDKLKIWVQDENGNSKLYSLREQGVGAICLQNASTEFGQRGMDGNMNAAIRNTGIFLYENGNVGTIQHLDLAREKLARYA